MPLPSDLRRESDLTPPRRRAIVIRGGSSIPSPVPDNTIDSAGFNYSAWDVALATESLAYIDPELVAMMSAAYRMQQVIEKDHDAIAQVSYQFTNQVHWYRGVLGYFGDTALHEKLLLERYDKLLPRLDQAVGDE